MARRHLNIDRVSSTSRTATQSRETEREATNMVLCPECENDLDIDADEIEEGDMISCHECGTDFEVVAADPLELAPISEDEDEEEDEEDEDEDDEE
jgi:alpha-aminoadipate/glutamate carrier protein LysW